MAITTSYGTTSVQGAREDLTDQVKRTHPEATPVISTLKHGPGPKALEQSWIADSLGEPNIDNTIIDGVDISFSGGYADNINSITRLSNRIQMMQKPFAVSRLAEKISVSGPQASLYAAAAAKALVELKLDCEAAVCSDNEPQTGTSSQGEKMGGLMHWTDSGSTTGCFDTSAKQAFRSVSGSRVNSAVSQLTESDLRGLLQKVFEASGKSVGYTLYAGPITVNAISDFSRASQAVTATGASFNVDTPNNVLSLSVTSYISDWGRIDIVPTLNIKRGAGTALSDASRRAALLIPKDDTVSINTMGNMSFS